MESAISIELGKRIRLERERLVLNQEAFGVICNVTSRTVIEWEKGKTFPNLLQLFELKEKGVNIGVLFDETFKGKTVEHVAFNDIDFAEKNSDHVLQAMNAINMFLAKKPTWKLLNIETRYGKKGEEVGLRYFYTHPVDVVFDESQNFRDSYMNDLIEDAHKHRSSYIAK